MTKPYMLSQIPSGCPYVQLLVLAMVPRISEKKSISCEDFVFARIRLKSIGWQDLAPRQRTRDFLWIHIPHQGFCDLPVIKSPNLSARGRASPVRLLQEAFFIFVLMQTPQCRSSKESE